MNSLAPPILARFVFPLGEAPVHSSRLGMKLLEQRAQLERRTFATVRHDRHRDVVVAVEPPTRMKTATPEMPCNPRAPLSPRLPWLAISCQPAPGHGPGLSFLAMKRAAVERDDVERLVGFFVAEQAANLQRPTIASVLAVYAGARNAGPVFPNSKWQWSPLAEYCTVIAPDICAPCRYWHSHDGDGLDAAGAAALAEVLRMPRPRFPKKKTSTFLSRTSPTSSPSCAKAAVFQSGEALRSRRKIMSEDRMTKEEFLANRKAAGRVIDVETCEIAQWCVEILDPYGVEPDLPDEMHCVGRTTFVRSAESDGWVSVYDLPENKARALYGRIERGVKQEEKLPWE